jgi:hypothetical protein
MMALRKMSKHVARFEVNMTVSRIFVKDGQVIHLFVHSAQRNAANYLLSLIIRISIRWRQGRHLLRIGKMSKMYEDFFLKSSGDQSTV